MKKLLFIAAGALVTSTLPFYASSGSLSDEPIIMYDTLADGTLHPYEVLEDEVGMYIDEEGDTVFEVLEEDDIVEDFLAPYIADFVASEYYFAEQGLDFPLENFPVDYQDKKYEKILDDAERVLMLLPDDPCALFVKAWVLDDIGRADEAREIATDCYVRYFADKSFGSLINKLLYTDADRTLAILEQKYEPSDESDINDAFYLHLANQAISGGYPRRALAYCDKVTSEQFLQGWAPAIKMLAYIKMDQPEKGLAMSRIINEDYRFIDWQQNTATLLRNAYGPQDTYDFIKEQLAISPSHTLKDTYITNLTLAGDYADALVEININLDSVLYEKFDSIDENGLMYVTGEAYNYNELCNIEDHLLLRRGIAYQLMGNHEAAKTDFETIEKRIEPSSVYCLAQAYLGNRDEALMVANPLFDKCPEFMASLYNVLGDTDKALECLAEAYEKGVWTPLLTRYDICQRSLLDHPRYPEVAAKFNPDRP